MSETLLKPDVGDAELITAVRGGDLSAYGTLFERHVDAARRLARQLTSPSDADDLVSDAFAKVLRVLQNGGGPDLAFRAYLLTAVRRLHVDKIRAGAKLQTTDDLEKFDPGVPFRDTAVEGFENSAAAAAFASLPERWQLVLWHTEVEGQKPAEVAELLGMSANSVSALAYRAREGLRQAFLNSHIRDLEDTECRWTHDHLGPYIRNGVSKRDGHKVEEHLDGCRKCMAIYLELTEVNSNLSGILAPIILGAAATGYLASGGAAAVKVGFLAAAAGRVRDGITANVPLSAAIGVAAVSTVVGVSVAVSLNQGEPANVADQPNAPTASSSTDPGDTDPSGTDPSGPAGNDPSRRTSEDASIDPTPTDITPSDVVPSDTTTDSTDGTLPSDGTTEGDPGTDSSGGGDGPGGSDGPGGGGGTGGGGGGHAPKPQSAFDYQVPRGQRTTTILVSELVTDEDGDELRFVRASLPDPHGTITIGSVTVPARGASAAARTEQALVYVPERGWGGPDLVKYRVTDGEHRVDGSFRIRTVNDAPTPVADALVRTPRGQTVDLDVLANDTDPDGDPLSLHEPKAEHGAVSVVEKVGLARLFAGDTPTVLRYTPGAEWSGRDVVTYVVSDGHHDEAASVVVLTNRAPVTVDDVAETGAGQPVTVDVVANDTDPDGDDLSLVSVEGAAHGTAAVVAGKVVYTPADGWDGDDTLTYTVSDGDQSATGTLTVTTTATPPDNRPPVAVDDVADTGAGQPVTVDVLANDTDPDGDDLTLVSTRGAQHGSADVVAGKVTYTPDAGWDGADTVTYVVSDGDLTATATLTVTTTAAPPDNRAPETQPDFADTGAGQPVTVDVLANDTDPDGDDLSLVSVDGAAHGTADIVAGNVVYTPADGWAGDDTLTYVVSDGDLTATGTLTVTTATAPPVNRAPVAVDDAADTGAGQPVTVDVLANDTDPDSDELSLVAVGTPGHGTAEVVGGRILYTPADGWDGPDAFDYTVSDGDLTATGTLTVTTATAPPVNRAPVAEDDFADTGAGQPVTVDVLANDTDPDGDDLTLVSVAAPGHGTATIADGRIDYTPADGWDGADTFTYTVSDGDKTVTGTLTVTTATAPPVNRAPVAVDDAADTGTGQSVTVDVLANDTDPDGDELTLVSVSGAQHGTATVVAGNVVYTPADGWAGPDTLEYVVSDGDLTATGTLTVTTAKAPPVNRAPVTEDDSANTGAGQPVTVDVLANDTDPDGDALTLVSTRGAQHGRAEVVAGKVVYTPDADWDGIDTLTYVVSDGDLTATGTLTVTTAPAPPVNRAPETQPDFADTAAGQPVTVDVLANDTDPDSDDLTLVSVGTPDHGTAQLVAGKVVYTPADGWDGADAFTYTVSDGDLTTTGTLTVTTAKAPPVNRAPVTEDDFADTAAGQPVTVDVLANDTDPDGDTLTLVSTRGAQHGTAELSDGTILYTPADGWDGADAFTYTVSDGDLTTTGTLTVTTAKAPPVNRAPETQPDFADTAAGQPVTVDVLANDTDPDGDDLTLVSVGTPDHGSAELVTGKVVYTPDTGWDGADAFTYTVSDGDKTATGTLTVTTAKAPPVNRAPETQPDFADTAAGQPVTVDVLANDTDPDGDDLSLESVEGAAHGTAELSDGKILYTPADGWDGADAFTYTVSDGDKTATGTLTVTTAKAPPVNRAPEAQPDFADTAAGQPVTVDVLANDTDPDEDDLTLVSVRGAQHGTAEVVAGRVTYTPDEGWAGADTLTYTVTDGDLDSIGTLTVTTAKAPPVNRAPVTEDDFADTGAGQPVTVDVLANDTDPDGDTLTLASVADPDHGTAEVVDGRVTYTPDTGWAGPDPVTYTVTDGDKSATGTLTVTTAKAPPVNHAPEPRPDNALTDFETPVSVDVLANDTDPDGDDLTLVSVKGAEHGTAVVKGSAVVYSPDKGWHGSDIFSYVVSDGTDTATGRVHVTTRPLPNRKPVANDDTATVSASSSKQVRLAVLGNDTDPDGDELTITGVDDVNRGSVVIDGRELVYRYPDDFVGTEVFSYIVTDGALTDTASVSVSIRNDAPIAVDDVVATPVAPGARVLVPVLANDSDPNGDALTLTKVTQPSRGTVAIEQGQVAYTASATATDGTDKFTYTVRDARGTSRTATVTVTVRRPSGDLTLRVTSQRRDADEDDVTVRTSGYPPEGGTGELTVTGSLTNLVVTDVPAGCTRHWFQFRITCDLSSARPDLTFTIYRNLDDRIRFTVAADFVDPDPTNNSVRWPED